MVRLLEHIALFDSAPTLIYGTLEHVIFWAI